MKHSRVSFIVLSLIILIACNSSDLFIVGVRPTPTPTFILAVYTTPTFIPQPTNTPALEPTKFILDTPEIKPGSNSTALPIDTNNENESHKTTPTTTSASKAIATPGATATLDIVTQPPTLPTATPTETVRPTLPLLAGRIAFPVDDGGGHYDVWVIELPDGEPFLVQARARQPNFSKDGRLLVNMQANDLGESIGLLDTTYTWQGILNQSPEDSYPFWQPDGTSYAYSNSNLVLDPDTAHLAPYIFTPCSLELPKFENDVECQDIRLGGKVVLGEAPVWTDDDRIAFFTYKGDDGIYFVENASWLWDTGWVDPPQLLVKSNGRPTDTAGFRVFFSAGDIDGNWEAYSIDLDGTNLTNHSKASLFQDGLPTVSPDGNWVAFVSDRDDKWGIWAVPFIGGEPSKVVDISKINTNPTPWGTDNRAWMTERITWGRSRP